MDLVMVKWASYLFQKEFSIWSPAVFYWIRERGRCVAPKKVSERVRGRALRADPSSLAPTQQRKAQPLHWEGAEEAERRAKGLPLPNTSKTKEVSALWTSSEMRRTVARYLMFFSQLYCLFTQCIKYTWK